MPYSVGVIQSISRVLGVLAFVIAFIALVGHSFNVPILYTYRPEVQSIMSIPTALSVLCLGSLIMVTKPMASFMSRGSFGTGSCVLRWGLLAVPTAIALYFTYYYLKGTGLFVLLALTHTVGETNVSFLTTVNLVLSLLALMMLDFQAYKSEWRMILGVSTPILVMFYISLFGIAGHLIEADVLYNYKMSLPTTIAFFLLSLALMFRTYPNGGLLSAVFSYSSRTRAMALAILVASIGKLCIESYKIFYVRTLLQDEDANLLVKSDGFEQMTLHLEMITLFLTVFLTILGLRTCYKLDLENMAVQNLLRQGKTLAVEPVPSLERT